MWDELRYETRQAPEESAFARKYDDPDDAFPRRLPSMGFREDEILCLSPSRYEFNYDHPGTPEIHASKWDHPRSEAAAALARASRSPEHVEFDSVPNYLKDSFTPEPHPCRARFECEPRSKTWFEMQRPPLYGLPPLLPQKPPVAGPPASYLPTYQYAPSESWNEEQRWNDYHSWRELESPEWGWGATASHEDWIRPPVYMSSPAYDVQTPSTVAPCWGSNSSAVDTQNSTWGQSTTGGTRVNSPRRSASSAGQYSPLAAPRRWAGSHLPAPRATLPSWGRVTPEYTFSPRSPDALTPAPASPRFFRKGERQRETAQHFEATIHRCAKERHWEKAIELLEEMKRSTVAGGPTVRAYTSAISACAKMGRSQEALDLLKEMKKFGVKPNVLTYSAAISACEKARKWKPALSLLEEIKRNGVEPDVITYNAAISACEKARQWRPALLLLREMREDANVTPDVISYSAAISACEKGGKLEQALQLFHEMKAQGVKPDVILYNATISACDKRGAWQQALSLLREMKGNDVEPDAITYSTAITACSRRGEAEEAVGLLREMRQQLVEPNGMAFLSAVSVCSKQGKSAECSELLRLMKELGFVHEKGGVWKRALSMGRRCRQRRGLRESDLSTKGYGGLPKTPPKSRGGARRGLRITFG